MFSLELTLVVDSLLFCGLQVAHADDLDVGDIYIEPTEPAQLTDEDSADEDGGGLVDSLQISCELQPK
ncbi:hypothetical protein JTB14_026668 [Gonioctena quinquepunctata]|nr:hypothetical protein JTB14_026668 [Gonioctena quinquepunctata]